MLSRVGLAFSEILCITTHILLLPVKLQLDVLHTEIAQFGVFFFPFPFSLSISVFILNLRASS